MFPKDLPEAGPLQNPVELSLDKLDGGDIIKLCPTSNAAAINFKMEPRQTQQQREGRNLSTNRLVAKHAHLPHGSANK